MPSPNANVHIDLSDRIRDEISTVYGELQISGSLDMDITSENAVQVLDLEIVADVHVR